MPRCASGRVWRKTKANDGKAQNAGPYIADEGIRPGGDEAAISDETVATNRRFHSRGDAALFAIAIFKFIKGAFLLALVCGAMNLFHKDLAAHVEHWLDQLHIDSNNRFIGALLAKLHLIHTKELKQLSALGAGYSALFLTEGTGLLFRQYWAEWLTIIATSSLIPFEVFQLVKQFTAIRLLLLVGNVGIVLFLIYRVLQRRSA